MKMFEKSLRNTLENKYEEIKEKSDFFYAGSSCIDHIFCAEADSKNTVWQGKNNIFIDLEKIMSEYWKFCFGMYVKKQK